MKGLLSANLWANWRRYIATGLAVAISTAFVTICLAISAGMNVALTSSIKDSYTGAAVVISAAENRGEDAPSWEEIAARVEQVDGVDQVSFSRLTMLTLVNGSTQVQRMAYSMHTEGFSRPEVIEGTLPDETSEIAIDQNAAQALRVGVGDEMTITGAQINSDRANSQSMRISAIVKLQNFSSGAAYLTGEDLMVFDPQAIVQSMLISSTEPQANSYPTNESRIQLQNDLAERIKDALGSKPGYETLSVHDAVENDLGQVQLGSAQLTAMLLVFPVIAAVVSVIVV